MLQGESDEEEYERNVLCPQDPKVDVVWNAFDLGQAHLNLLETVDKHGDKVQAHQNEQEILNQIALE